MGKIFITCGDFLKNSGIVGMKYLLNMSEAKEEEDYGISEDDQSLWLDDSFAVEADWTDLYFKACIKYFGESTTYQRILETIGKLIEKLKEPEGRMGKEIKEDIKYVNDKLLSNSYQSGFANIEKCIEFPEIYEKLKKHKLNDKIDKNELENRLKELELFLKQPLCRETFIMKNVVYTYINRFWDGKCFLLRANAKKDMREVFEKDFAKPLRNYWKEGREKAKDLCIDCGMPMERGEKVSIAFIKDMADDLARKRSAFWNGKVDAFLCPACAFVYALSPLGFQQFGNKFVFVNTNDSMDSLLRNNNKDSKEIMDAKKEDGEKYSAWFARLMNIIFSQKTKEIRNIQVILRSTDAEDRYRFSVLGKKVVEVLNHRYVRAGLDWLGKYPYVKVKNEFINVHEQVVFNILCYRNQYALLNRLLKASIDQEMLLVSAYWVYRVQIGTDMVHRKRKNEGDQDMSWVMRENGFNLRKEILRSKGTQNDECMRGTIYQLLNALSVRNEEKFMDLVIRLYTSTKLSMPDGFVYMLGNQEKFMEDGYSFVLGLKGSRSDKEVK